MHRFGQYEHRLVFEHCLEHHPKLFCHGTPLSGHISHSASYGICRATSQTFDEHGVHAVDAGNTQGTFPSFSAGTAEIRPSWRALAGGRFPVEEEFAVASLTQCFSSPTFRRAEAVKASAESGPNSEARHGTRPQPAVFTVCVYSVYSRAKYST